MKVVAPRGRLGVIQSALLYAGHLVWVDVEKQ